MEGVSSVTSFPTIRVNLHWFLLLNSNDKKKKVANSRIRCNYKRLESVVCQLKIN